MKKIFSLIGFLALCNILVYAQPSWTAQSSGTIDRFRSVFFTDANTGYAVGHMGTILKTVNAGAIWTAQTSGTDLTLFSVYFTNSETGYATGSIGLLLKTNDGGTSWFQQTIGTTNQLGSVFFTSADTGYIVGGQGNIFKTIDGSTNWTTQTSGTFKYLSSVFFIDANTGYAVGDSGTIIKTNDAGLNWIVQSSGITEDLCSVYFIDKNTGFAVGGGGRILKTSDGGTNWTVQTSGTGNWITSICFIDSTTGYAVGENGTILRTTDAGNSWIAQTSGTNQILFSVDFTDANTGFAVGDSGTILSTVTTQPCNVSFQYSASPSGNVDFTATATVTDSIAYPITYLWNYGDGSYTTTYSDTISHVYNSSGFEACVTMQTANGCSSTYCDTIILDSTNQCLPNFSYQENGGSTYFYGYVDTMNVPIDSVNSWTWTFTGGGASYSSTLQNPVMQLTPNTFYVVCLSITTYGGCGGSYCQSVYVGTPCPIVVTIFQTQPTPGQCDGTITAVALGGAPPYAYLWNTGAATSTITNLCGGMYYVTVTDAYGCVAYANAYLIDSTTTWCNAFFIYYENPDSTVSFHDSSYASFGIMAWNWVIYDNLQNVVFTSTLQNPQFVNLNAVGTYTAILTITTSNGNSCSYTSTIVITGTSPCTYTASMDITQISVIGGNDGAIDLTVIGGTSPYSFLWSTGQTTEDISGLYSGNYTVMILDNDSACQGISLTGYIFEPYDTTGGNIIIDTLTAPILDTCLNFVPDTFYISQIDIINNTTVVVTWVFEYQGQMQTIEVSYTFSSNGNYMVTLTINCGSKALTTYSSYIHIDAVLGVADVISDENISVFPNPASSFFNIDATPPYNYTVTSISGQVVYSSTSEIGHSTVNSSDIPAGIYFVRIENAVNSYVSKIIITR